MVNKLKEHNEAMMDMPHKRIEDLRVGVVGPKKLEGRAYRELN